MVNALVLLVASIGSQTAQGQLRVASSWDRVAPTLAVVSAQGRPTGLAVVVSADGVLLAHQDSVPLGAGLQVTVSGPQVFNAQVVGRDPVTGLVGLKVTDWPVEGRAFASVARQDPAPSSIVLAATLAGPVQGQAARNRADGHLGNSNRFVPLIEIRFEQSSDRVAGAILFDQSGRLVGVLGATLSQSVTVPKAPIAMAKAMESASAGAPVKVRESNVNFGPQPLTTGYALGTPVLARVIRGLSSPTHTVQHPTIGVSFKDDFGVNHLTRVDPRSKAEQAGLREGDTVLAVGSRAVRSSVELGSALFELEIGSTVPFTVQRGSERLVLRVTIGGS